MITLKEMNFTFPCETAKWGETDLVKSMIVSFVWTDKVVFEKYIDSCLLLYFNDSMNRSNTQCDKNWLNVRFIIKLVERLNIQSIGVRLAMDNYEFLMDCEYLNIVFKLMNNSVFDEIYRRSVDVDTEYLWLTCLCDVLLYLLDVSSYQNDNFNDRFKIFCDIIKKEEQYYLKFKELCDNLSYIFKKNNNNKNIKCIFEYSKWVGEPRQKMLMLFGELFEKSKSK